MIINRIQLNNFRNYETLDVDFTRGVNLLYGDNAQGKTNILEAVYVSATTKSLRNSKDREMIRLGRDEAHISTYLTKDNCPHKIDMHLKKNKVKGIAIDGIPIKKSSELMGLLHVISFSPDDLSMMKEGPQERRRFLDMELCQMDRVYCSNLAGYNHSLVQRNSLLKQLAESGSKELAETLEVWNRQLVAYGTEVIRRRRSFVSDIMPIVKEKHSLLSEGREELCMGYLPNCSEESFEEKLFLEQDRDIYLRCTSVGPHRDDLDFTIDGNSVRLYGSQGQQRTVALALKLAEIEIVKNRLKEEPVLLLDDVLSELDRNRQLQLLSEIKSIQTIVTCTGMEEFVSCRTGEDSVYLVRDCSVRKMPGENPELH